MDWKNFKASHKITLYDKKGYSKSLYLHPFEMAIVIASVEYEKIVITKLSKQLDIFKNEEE